MDSESGHLKIDVKRVGRSAGDLEWTSAKAR
jgi:hypothetical protein